MERYLIPRKLALICTGVLLCIVILHGMGIVSADRVESVLPLFCPFKALTGIPCPGCGMTRAILAVTKGDFHGAFSYNPFSFFLLFMVAISVVPGKLAETLPSIMAAIMNYLFIVVLISVLLFWFFARLLPAL
jgi:hypothetical protein